MMHAKKYGIPLIPNYFLNVTMSVRLVRSTQITKRLCWTTSVVYRTLSVLCDFFVLLITVALLSWGVVDSGLSDMGARDKGRIVNLLITSQGN